MCERTVFTHDAAMEAAADAVTVSLVGAAVGAGAGEEEGNVRDGMTTGVSVNAVVDDVEAATGKGAVMPAPREGAAKATSLAGDDAASDGADDDELRNRECSRAVAEVDAVDRDAGEMLHPHSVSVGMTLPVLLPPVTICTSVSTTARATT